MEGTSIAQFFDLLQINPPRQPMLLVGDTGIGKTSIVRQVAEKVLRMEMSYIPCMESTDMIDVTGVMDVSGDHSVYKPPSWYHEGTDVVVLMDEVNRNKAVMKGLMRLATDRKAGDAQLTDNSYVIAAINPENDATYQVYEMDPAMVARFLVVYLRPTPEEWLEYAESEGVHPAILEYIRGHKEDLDPFENDDNMSKAKGSMYHNVLPTRRGWFGLSELLHNGEKFRTADGRTVNRFDRTLYADGEHFIGMIVRGLVGNGVAERFVPAYYAGASNIPTPEALMNGTDKDWESVFPKQIARLCIDDPIAASALSTGVCRYIATRESKLWNSSMTKPSLLAAKFAKNLYRFMYCCSAEVQANMFHSDIETVDLNKTKWPKLLGTAFPGLPDFLEARFVLNKNK